jgi:hypothetical protein
LSPETFERTARQALESLDAELQAFVRQSELYIADAPGVEVVVDGVDPRALILLDGVTGTPGSASARVFVYQQNVERLAGAVELVEAELRAALEREIRAAFLEPDAAEPPTPLN